MERANEHAQELNAEIQRFYKTNPYEIVHDFDETGKEESAETKGAKGLHIYRVIIRHEVPDRIAILAGAVVQELRSALDYVAWQLALAQSETPPPTTAFPIFASPKLYKRDRLRFIDGIDLAIHPVFDSVQPHLAGDKAREQPLWVLHRLANDDRHKIPTSSALSLPASLCLDPQASISASR
jgi:hypothetical protein